MCDRVHLLGIDMKSINFSVASLFLPTIRRPSKYSYYLHIVFKKGDTVLQRKSRYISWPISYDSNAFEGGKFRSLQSTRRLDGLTLVRCFRDEKRCMNTNQACSLWCALCDQTNPSKTRRSCCWDFIIIFTTLSNRTQYNMTHQEMNSLPNHV